jgi:hypothetical protein
VLHRDLKPGNILLDAQGEPHITDFGLAKRLEGDTQLTLSGAVLGTPSYMSPEAAAGGTKLATTAADIYSLGAILYELLTGKPPFVAETPLATMRQVMDEEPARPSNLNRTTDHDLETICLKCLEKNPARRYGSADALANDLDRWLRQEPILARRSTTRERLLKWTRRHPAHAAGTASLLLVLAAGVAGCSLAFARDGLPVAGEHQQRQFRELEQRPHRAVGRRDDQDGHRQSADGESVLSPVQAVTRNQATGILNFGHWLRNLRGFR